VPDTNEHSDLPMLLARADEVSSKTSRFCCTCTSLQGTKCRCRDVRDDGKCWRVSGTVCRPFSTAVDDPKSRLPHRANRSFATEQPLRRPQRKAPNTPVGIAADQRCRRCKPASRDAAPWRGQASFWESATPTRLLPRTGLLSQANVQIACACKGQKEGCGHPLSNLGRDAHREA